MARCKKCSYLLVLLPKRNKYKCSKCSSLFPQKEIDNKEFRVWNKSQRVQDIENIKPEKKPRIKLSQEERKLRAKESAKIWRENNKERCRELSEIHYEKNKDKILAKKKIYRQEVKDKDRIRRKEYRHQQIDRTRQLARIHWWRQKQKALALRELKNIEEKAYNANIFISPLTLVHYHLLPTIGKFKKPKDYEFFLMNGHSSLVPPDLIPNSEVKQANVYCCTVLLYGKLGCCSSLLLKI